MQRARARLFEHPIVLPWRDPDEPVHPLPCQPASQRARIATRTVSLLALTVAASRRALASATSVGGVFCRVGFVAGVGVGGGGGVCTGKEQRIATEGDADSMPLWRFRAAAAAV